MKADAVRDSMRMEEPKRRFGPGRVVFLFIVVIAFFFFLHLQCGREAETPIPPGWQAHSFKLTEHPEALLIEPQPWDIEKGEFTIADDTRPGFFLDRSVNLSFDVFLPEGGTIKFAYCAVDKRSILLEGAFSDKFEYHLGLEAGEFDGEDILGQWPVYTGDEKEYGIWREVVVNIPAGFSGKNRITFFRIVKGDLWALGYTDCFIAHPTIVAPDNGGERRRVIWITVDTLRADHLGCYGYERETSSNIDEFAEESTLFERCLTVCPWTFPSYASMFTGRYPSITGATTGVWYLPENEQTLAELISKKDYATFCASNVIWISEKTGLNSGFDMCKWFVLEYADVSFSLAQDWLNKHSDEDCFMVIHLIDPHVPYKPKEKFQDTFDPDYQGRFKHDFPNFGPVWEGEMMISEREQEHLEALYDEDILSCDADIGEFIGFLKDKGYYEDSLIIINADHGEEFWEHGGFEHGHSLYDEVLHVPMVIRGPGFEWGKRVDGMCATIDIFPTILEWLNIEKPDGINAISLNELIQGNAEPEKRMLLSEQLYHGTEQKGVSTDRYRYILHTIDRMEELYDYTEDPAMLLDVATDRRATSRNFRYFATEYMLNEDVGWHVRFFRNQGSEVGAKYEGTITAPSGIASYDDSRLDADDILAVEGNSLVFSLSVDPWSSKAFDFRTNDENDEVSFEVKVDGEAKADGFIFFGPEKIPYALSRFTLSILDPMFGLGQPSFGPIGLDVQTGMFIWGNSETLREQISPEIDDRTREELKSLGYLN